MNSNSIQYTVNRKDAKAYGIKFFIEKDGQEVGRAFLYIMHNDLKKEPFGLLEDVFVDEKMRGQGIGTALLNQVIAKAQELGCYKLVATSRYGRDEVHKMYEKRGFQDFGKEFKMYFGKPN